MGLRIRNKVVIVMRLYGSAFTYCLASQYACDGCGAYNVDVFALWLSAASSVSRNAVYLCARCVPPRCMVVKKASARYPSP